MSNIRATARSDASLNFCANRRASWCRASARSVCRAWHSSVRPSALNIPSQGSSTRLRIGSWMLRAKVIVAALPPASARSSVGRFE
jgi:hypothetical protein